MAGTSTLNRSHAAQQDQHMKDEKHQGSESTYGTSVNSGGSRVLPVSRCGLVPSTDGQGRLWERAG